MQRFHYVRGALRSAVFACALAAAVWSIAAAQPATPQPLPAAASPLPGTPAPSVSPPPVALPSVGPLPSPTPSPEASPSPLSLSKTRLQVSVGGVSATRIVGGVAPYTATLSNPVASVHIDAATATLSLDALANGSATLTVTDATGASVTASLLVAPLAGFVPAEIDVSLIGNPSHEFIDTQIRDALVRAAHPRPGVRLAAASDEPAIDMRPGERLDVPVRVHLDGANRYVDVDGIANVHVVTAAAAAIDPVTLFYSDDPEKIRTDGVLFTGSVAAGQPIRLYYYHQAAVAGLAVVILLDCPAGDAQVQVVGQGAGPNAAVMFVGQSATLRYLDAHARGAGVALDVPVGAPVELFTGDRSLATGDLVAGVLDLAVTTGDAVRFTVAAVSEGSVTRALPGSPELPTDGKHRRGEYDLSSVPLALDYRVGEAESAPVTVGALASALQNRRPGGHVLAGDYGLLRPLDLRFTNPSGVPATVYLYEQPIGFPVTTSMLLHGEAAPLKVQCVKNGTERYLVRAFSVPANADERVTGDYMTDGGSTYPLSFGLSSAAPSAPPLTMTSPDGCFPKAVPAVPVVTP